MLTPQFNLPLHSELVVDLFAGGGGASTGIEQAIGRSVDVAINHDPEAISLHQANHPQTMHYCSDVFEVDPVSVTGNRPVGLLWASPDCKHFSKAKGGKPVSKKIRSLAWVVVKWAKIRKRLFLVARCDGLPIVWPAPTHGDPKRSDTKGRGLKPWRTAAECIDWALPTPSIFERTRPLADATLRRIARGIVKYVLEAQEPFIVSLTHQGSERVEGLAEPFKTITGANRGEKALVVPIVSSYYGHKTDQGEARGSSIEEPIKTQTTENRHALVTAFLAKHYGGVIGTDLGKPISTVTSVDHHSLVSVSIMTNNTGHSGAAANAPIPTITTGGHHAAVAALLVKYYGTDQDPRLEEPLHTVTTKDRFGLVIVHIGGEPYVITDIGMRMLQPHELYAAQGFPADYIIDQGADGKRLSKSAQVRMCGNSVCPPMAKLLVEANYVMQERKEAA